MRLVRTRELCRAGPLTMSVFVRPPSQIRARRGDPSPLGPSFGSPSRSGYSIASSTRRPAVKASWDAMLNVLAVGVASAVVVVMATILGVVELLWKAVAAIAGP